MTEKLELIVTKSTLGTLETNIAALEAFVAQRLEEYKPETYMGDADEAKKDRAELNKAKKLIGEKRRTIISELSKPYQDFEARCKKVEGDIDKASMALDVIVKTRENEEKAAKRKELEALWQTKNFTLFPLGRIWNDRWLNKTYKASNISEEMDASIAKFYEGLKAIEAQGGEDMEMLKAYYMDCIDVGLTLEYGARLKENRKKAAREKAEREEREHRERLERQKAEIQRDSEHWREGMVARALADEAIAEDDKPLEPIAITAEYTFTVNVDVPTLNIIKDFLTKQGIEYQCEKLEF